MNSFSSTLVFLTVMIPPLQAQFSLWPPLDPDKLASILDFSSECLNAMNTTVACDPDLFRMAGQLDMYYWVQDNLTDLCTASCIQSASDWLQHVQDNCAGQTINIASKLVPTESVALRYADGLGLACLTDIELPIQLNLTQPPESEASSEAPPALTSAITTEPVASNPNNGTGVPFTVNNLTFDYCFLQAQNWIGVEISDPDCGSDPKNVLCVDPDAANRIANLYNDTVLCSNCFLSVMWWRINSPFLPDADESDDLIAQYQDISDVCNVTMPPSLIRALPSYADAPPPTYLNPGTDPSVNATTPDNSTCAGQLISANNHKRDSTAPLQDVSNVFQSGNDFTSHARVKRASAGSCNSLSQAYGVTTGDIQSITGADDCSFNTSSICVPLKCDIRQVGSNESCASIATSLSTSTMNVTLLLFLQWNPQIIGLCDALTPGQYICKGPPGGGYTLPPPLNSSNTNAASQQRGGQGSGNSSNPDGPTGPAGPPTNSTASAPTQTGIAASCTAFAYAGTNDTCFGLTQRYSITLAQLTAWNPVLGYPDGHDCATEFWTGYDYCVGVAGTSSTLSSKGPGVTTAAATTSSMVPTQSGIASNCKKIVVAKKGDTCYQFAQDNGITTAQLYAWNPVLGSNGAACSTQFQAGVGYCVAVE